MDAKKNKKYMAGGGKTKSKYMAGGGKMKKYMKSGGATNTNAEGYQDYVKRMFGGGMTGPAMKKNK